MAELNLSEIQDIIGGEPGLLPASPPEADNQNQELSIDELQGILSGAVVQSTQQPTQEPSPPVDTPTPTGRGIAGQRVERERQAFLAKLPEERRQLLESVTPFEALMIGAGKGVTDIGRGLGMVEPATPQEKESFKQLEEAYGAATVGEVAGQAAPFLIPGGAVARIPSTAARVGATAALGAAEGGLIARGTDQDVGQQLLSAGIGGTVAGALELGLPVIGRAGGKIVRRVTGSNPSEPVVNAVGEPSEELIESLTREGMTFDELVQSTSQNLVSGSDEAIKAASVSGRAIDRAIRDAAPTRQVLEQSSRNIYNQIDELGVSIRPSAYERLPKQLRQIARNEGFNRRLHPKVHAALDEFEELVEGAPKVSDLDTARKVMQSAARSVEPEEARLGRLMIDNVDNYLDNLRPESMILGGQRGSEVGAMYREARGLWQRAKKAQLIDQAVELAGDQLAGFESGLRNQFKNLLGRITRNKLKGFSKDEVAAIRQVVRGGKVENTAKALGKFGFSEDQAVRMLVPGLGVAGGAAVGGPVGAVVVPAIGQVSRNLAQKLTKGNAEFANAVIRAGKNGRQITRQYLEKVPKSEQTTEDLMQLLVNQDAATDRINTLARTLPRRQRNIVENAVYFIENVDANLLRQSLSLGGAATATGAIAQEENN